MKIYNVILLVLLTLFFYSCNPNKVKIKNIQNFVNKTIVFPEGLISNTISENNLDKIGKIVIYVDSAGCSSCRLNELYRWKINKEDSLLYKNIDLLIILFTDAPDKVNLGLKNNNFNSPVCYDIKGGFGKVNNLPDNPLFHTFLLDKNNKVILVGSPIGNDKMWELYKSTIKKLVENDGKLTQ